MNEAADQRQSEKFKALARELEADQDEARWDEQLVKLVSPKKADDTPAEDS